MMYAIAAAILLVGVILVIRAVRNERQRPDHHMTDDGQVLLADTWQHRRDAVTGYNARIRLEAKGFTLPHATWNDEWVSTIRATHEHMANPQWHTAYIMRRRKAAKLPDLVLPPDLRHTGK